MERSVKIKLGKRLRELRRKHYPDKSLTEVAAIIGVDKQRLSGWENGRFAPNLATQFRLCEVFRIYDLRKFYPDLNRS